MHGSHWKPLGDSDEFWRHLSIRQNMYFQHSAMWLSHQQCWMQWFLSRKSICLFKPVWWREKSGPSCGWAQGRCFIGVRKVEAEVQGKRLVWRLCSLADPLGCFVCVFPVFCHDPHCGHVPYELCNRSALLPQEELNISSPCLNSITRRAVKTKTHKNRPKNIWQEASRDEDSCYLNNVMSRFTC